MEPLTRTHTPKLRGTIGGTRAGHERTPMEGGRQPSQRHRAALLGGHRKPLAGMFGPFATAAASCST
eukprot:15463754-Alexandrium_andersonii.AAC.1